MKVRNAIIVLAIILSILAGIFLPRYDAYGSIGKSLENYRPMKSVVSVDNIALDNIGMVFVTKDWCIEVSNHYISLVNVSTGQVKNIGYYYLFYPYYRVSPDKSMVYIFVKDISSVEYVKAFNLKSSNIDCDWAQILHNISIFSVTDAVATKNGIIVAYSGNERSAVNYYRKDGSLVLQKKSFRYRFGVLSNSNGDAFVVYFYKGNAVVYKVVGYNLVRIEDLTILTDKNIWMCLDIPNSSFKVFFTSKDFRIQTLYFFHMLPDGTFSMIGQCDINQTSLDYDFPDIQFVGNKNYFVFVKDSAVTVYNEKKMVYKSLIDNGTTIGLFNSYLLFIHHKKLFVYDLKQSKLYNVGVKHFYRPLFVFSNSKTIWVVLAKNNKFYTADLKISYVQKNKFIITMQVGNTVMVTPSNVIYMDVPPMIIAKWNRTFIPARYIAEAIGASISWNPTNKEVSIFQQGKLVITLWIGKPYAVVKGKKVWIDPNNHDVVPVIIKGRTMLPLRFVVESMGFEVKWNSFNKTITLSKTLSKSGGA